jgi:hypothetical protein
MEKIKQLNKSKLNNDKLKKFIQRLNKCGINIKLHANYPWIYVYEINGRRIPEKYFGNHGFTIAFFKTQPGNELNFTNIPLIFKIIRKYR